MHNMKVLWLALITKIEKVSFLICKNCNNFINATKKKIKSVIMLKNCWKNRPRLPSRQNYRDYSPNKEVWCCTSLGLGWGLTYAVTTQTKEMRFLNKNVMVCYCVLMKYCSCFTCLTVMYISEKVTLFTNYACLVVKKWKRTLVHICTLQM